MCKWSCLNPQRKYYRRHRGFDPQLLPNCFMLNKSRRIKRSKGLKLGKEQKHNIYSSPKYRLLLLKIGKQIAEWLHLPTGYFFAMDEA